MAFIGTFSADILADTKPPEGQRLTTMELTYPRCIHAEFMTHRMFSRNSASSRAIPIEKVLERIDAAPFVPLVWGMNQKGMQARTLHGDPVRCEAEWLAARDVALEAAIRLNDLNLHKQIVNRVVEPWMWITVIATGVKGAWENFFKLRCHPDAEPHIQEIAYMARELYDAELDLRDVEWGESHLPLTGFDGDDGLDPMQLKAVSTARCARVSYLTHDGKRDVQADLDLHERLSTNGHWSPFEHVAECTPINEGLNMGGNFGAHWIQYRKLFPSEYCTEAPRY